MASAERQAGRVAWNKGKLVGQKAPLKLNDVWAIRIRLQIKKRVRELALLDLGIDSKLGGRERDRRSTDLRAKRRPARRQSVRLLANRPAKRSEVQ